MRKSVSRPLRRNVKSRPAGVDFPAAANPDWYTGERGSWEAENVGRHLGRMNDCDVMFAAPPAEMHEVAGNLDVLKTGDWKSSHRGGRLGRALEPGPRLLETREMHEPATAIQPPEQFDHLAFCAAWFEAAQKESYRDRTAGVHANGRARAVPDDMNLATAGQARVRRAAGGQSVCLFRKGVSVSEQS